MIKLGKRRISSIKLVYLSLECLLSMKIIYAAHFRRFVFGHLIVDPVKCDLGGHNDCDSLIVVS